MHKIKNIRFACLSLFFLLFFNGYSQKFKVALDAGHGDHDHGASYQGHTEKKINLAIVLKVGKILEQNPNVEVVYTRKTDVFIGLIERANIANKADANIFVSIHCNANPNKAADGTETYVMGMSKVASNLEAAKNENQVITMEKDYKTKYEGYDLNKPETMIGTEMIQEEFQENSVALAGKIQNNFVKYLGKKSRGGGVKQAPYMVLHKAYMPRVLIETGFVSNAKEGAVLDSEDGQQEIAEAIAAAIVEYKKEYFREDSNDPDIKPIKRTFSAIPEKQNIVKKDSVIKKEVIKKVEPIFEEKGIIFKIQIAASSKKVEASKSNFKGLNPISCSKENNYYKYMYGNTSSYEEAKKLLLEAKEKGYSSSYIVAYRDGKNIKVQEAIK